MSDDKIPIFAKVVDFMCNTFNSMNNIQTKDNLSAPKHIMKRKPYPIYFLHKNADKTKKITTSLLMQW